MIGTQKCSEVAEKCSCKICDYTTCKQSVFDKHLLTAKHRAALIRTQKSPEISGQFFCKKCDYICSKQSDLKKHVLSTKHLSALIGTQKCSEVAEKCSTGVRCQFCKKVYATSSGLWRHKQKCYIIEPPPIPETKIDTDKELILILIKENSELKHMMLEQHTSTQNMMMDVIKNGTHNTTNSHNKTFNLQFFLNETCKDAMNITDFVNNIQLQLSDLEKMGDVGYVNGISNIIVKNLKDMDISSRPIHCTDIKREIMYIKDEDKWDKELNGNPKVRNAIKHIAHKNSKLLNEFKEKNPDYNNSSSKVSDKYNKLLIETMGGKGDNDAEKENKIIKNITKEVLVEKDIPLS